MLSDDSEKYRNNTLLSQFVRIEYADRLYAPSDMAI